MWFARTRGCVTVCVRLCLCVCVRACACSFVCLCVPLSAFVCQVVRETEPIPKLLTWSVESKGGTTEGVI
jgi:hypothetical protein